MSISKQFLIVALITGFVIGCASTPTIPPVGQRTVMKESSKMPDWYTHVPAEKNDILYFRGIKTRALAMEDGLTDARMDAMRNIAERVQTVIHTSYEKARTEYGIPKDDQDAGKNLEDGIVAQAKATLIGVKEKDAWWEEYSETGAARVSYFYDVAVLMEFSKSDFDKSLANTLGNAEQKAKDEKNKKAADVLDRMRQDIKNNP